MFMEIGIKRRRYRSCLLVDIGILRLTEGGYGRLREGVVKRALTRWGSRIRTMIMG